MCAAESFAFARRMGFSLEGGRAFESLLAESRTPESERYTGRKGKGKGRGTEAYYRGVIDKEEEKMKKKREKKDILTIDSNSISIFFYQLYFSNYICTLTRKLIDQAMFRACGRNEDEEEIKRDKII